MADRVVLLVGTKRGAFLLSSDTSRRDWEVSGPFCDAWPVNDVSWDPRTDTVYAAGMNAWYGPSVWRSEDRGASWTQSSEGMSYGDDGPTISSIWNVTPGHGAVYAGVDPAGLFRSDDGGRTWAHVGGLRAHETFPRWQPGGGGLCLHTIVPAPEAGRMWIGISAVGVFETADGGDTWETRNEGLRGFYEDGSPVGTCVHKVKAAPGGRLWQQNHQGTYRSEDGGGSWTEVTEGLPSDFAFPIAVHPRDPDTAWVFPLNGAEHGRFVPDGKPAVWRTRDAGASWQRFDAGFPRENAYLQALREGMASDHLDPGGVYVGTTNGQVYASADEGETWVEAASHLPPVLSVDVAVW